MRRTVTIRIAAVAVALTALLGGCTSTVTGTGVPDPRPAPTEGPGSDPVAWADRLCTAVVTLVKPALTAPDFSGAADLAGIKQKLSDYLGSILTGVQQGRAQLKAVGRSPVTGGDETVQNLDKSLAELEQKMSDAKAKIDAADPNNPEAFQAALTDAQTVLQQLTTANGFGDLGSLPRLNRASEQAASCQQLAALLPH